MKIIRTFSFTKSNFIEYPEDIVAIIDGVHGYRGNVLTGNLLFGFTSI